MMVEAKLDNDDCKTINKLLKEGHSVDELAKEYNVSIATIYRRVKYPYQEKNISIDIKNNIRR